MFTSITIENFRALKQLTLNDLGRVNLIAGKNNTGKTSVLEALFLLSGSLRRPDLRFMIDLARGIENAGVQSTVIEAWKEIFRDLDTSQAVIISAENSSNPLNLRIVATENDTTSTFTPPSSENTIDSFTSKDDSRNQIEYFYRDTHGSYQGRVRLNKNRLNEAQWQMQNDKMPAVLPALFLFSRSRYTLEQKAEYFSRAQKMGLKETLVNYLKLIEPKLTDLALLYEDRRPFIHGSGIMGNSQYISVALMGDGLNRLLEIILAIISISNEPEGKGIVLIDEIENGFHYSILEQVWKVIGETARALDVQVFATTHSYECIEAAHKAFSESSEYDFRYHRLGRLKKLDNEIGVVTYEQDVLEAAFDMNLEVR